VNYLSLFSGIGGLDLGLDRAGMTCVGQVEKDEFCRRVLARHWPEVPRHDDVRTAPNWWAARTRPAVHVVAGGFPCQPVSSAGLRRAQQDSRWLWPAMAAVIDALRPEWAIGENVPGLLNHGIADVLDDLRQLGYLYRVGSLSACAMGAPHTRSRLFIVAHSEGGGCGRRGGWPRTGERGEAGPQAGHDGWSAPQRSGWWTTEPDVARMANGVPRGVDRRRALGNAVVPQVGEAIGRIVMAAAGELVPA
jgi:DNA (cytosine-5)-methyltransferase 1